MNHKLTAGAAALKINIAKPFEDLPKRSQSLLLEGGNGFVGLVKILDETFSEAGAGYREWLMDYMSPSVCPACHGRRLRPTTLPAPVKNTGLPDLTQMSIDR